MATTVHTWVTRAHCPGCDQFLWTNPGSGSVICGCGASEIQEDVVITGDVVTDEVVFAQAVADDLNVSVEDLELLEG